MASRAFRIVSQVFRLLLTVLLHTAFFAMLITRLKFNSPTWEVVFIPLFVFDFFVILYTTTYFAQYCMKKANDWESSREAEESLLMSLLPVASTNLIALLFVAVGLCLKITAEVLLLVYLNGQIDRPFIPGLLFCLLFAEVWIAFTYYSLLPHTIRTLTIRR